MSIGSASIIFFGVECIAAAQAGIPFLAVPIAVAAPSTL
jgi:hypothetical protein